MCVRTSDGAKTWGLLSYIGADSAGSSYMPSAVHLETKKIVAAIRRNQQGRNWIDLYRSENAGKTWRFVNQAVRADGPDNRNGMPPSLTRLQDGRVVLIYGYRSQPYGIRARISSDEGISWGEEIILRQDGGNSALGYPRAVQRPDGKVLALYYFNDDANRERYISATIWDTGTAGKQR
jgi:hypothetical protein